MSKKLLPAYVVLLDLVLAAIIGFALVDGSGFDENPLSWALLTALLYGTESVSLFFYGRHAGRISLSTAESILVPMFVVLTFPQVVVGAVVANTLARLSRWQVAPLKEAFNVGQYGVAAALAAWFWQSLSEPARTLTIRNAVVAAGAAVVFQVATHLFVALAIAISEKRSLVRVSIAVAPATLVNLVGSVMVGVIFTAAYLTAHWTIALFPVLLGGLYLGYRAILNQARERERVEQLHVATRALASSPELEQALGGFLVAVTEIVSASEARAYVRLSADYVWSGVRDGEIVAPLQETAGGAWEELVAELAVTQAPISVTDDDQGSLKEVAAALGVENFVAVPLIDDGDVTGCLFAADRVGAGEFGEPDQQLLAALANELLLTVGSHRLFAEVVEERERFARIFNGSTEGICLIDSAGIVRAWNPALEKISGYAAGDVLGRGWSDVVMLRDVDQQRIEGTQLVVIPPDTQVELVTKNGPTRWVSLLSGPTQTNEDPGWVVLVRDVSAEHELESAKSDFLSTISHELRTPLTTIKGSLQVLERGSDRLPPELASQMIGVTTRGAERLERLVMNLLVVSQIESGGLPVFVEEVPLDDVVLERIGIILRDHERLQVDQRHEKLTVRGDRERIGQAIEHILDNALKFGGPDGLITIEVERRNGYAHVAVTDEGPGIAAHDQEKIWERFVRLGDVLTRETQGAGVGLFITKRSIEALEGDVWVESEPGKGSTFHMTVPLAHPMVVEEQADTA